MARQGLEAERPPRPSPPGGKQLSSGSEQVYNAPGKIDAPPVKADAKHFPQPGVRWNPQKKKKLLFLALKVSVSALLLAVIFRKAGLQDVYSHLRSMDLRFFLAASLIHLVIVYFASLRWGLLLEEKYPSGKLFSLYLIGSFFNNILPGAVGGDA